MLQCIQALQIKSHSLLTILLILGGSWVTQWKSMKTSVLFWPRPDRPITIQMFSGLVTRGPSSKNTPRPAPDCDGISRYQPTCWGWSRPTSCTCSPNNCQWSSDPPEKKGTHSRGQEVPREESREDSSSNCCRLLPWRTPWMKKSPKEDSEEEQDDKSARSQIIKCEKMTLMILYLIICTL